MRVLYSFPHQLGRPGIATTAYHQVQGLIDHGLEVDVVCTSLAREVHDAQSMVETLVLGGRRVPHRILGVDRAYAYHDWRAAQLLERLAAEVDVVHTWPAACLRTIRAARRLGIPSFREAPSAHTQTAYEDAAREAAAVGVELPPNHHHRYDDGHLRRELEEFAAADFLLVPSAYVEQTFLRRGFDCGRLLRHRYGYDPAAFAPAQPRPHGEGLTAVFVGRGEPNKGLHHALRAWVDSGAAERGTFLLCGDVLPAYRARLAPLLADASVRELGFVDPAAEVMREADVLVLPSVTEGSALVTYEAQAAGCALLVSTAAGAPFDDGVEGLVHEPGDVAALTEHLRLLEGDRAVLQRMREAALRNAQRLTWTGAAEALAEAYAAGAARRRHTCEPMVATA